ncbi:MAG: PAS domain S-box protein [Deltaproteobacteria bacterium]|nr:PAS domain S-box protein [Deltaproteobacteria bacterium]
MSTRQAPFQNSTFPFDVSSTRRHLDRTASIFKAVRGINRGVVIGEDSIKLISSAIEKLISEKILTTAWLYLHPAKSTQSKNVAHGWGPAFAKLAEKMDSGWLPHCCETALTEECIVTLQLPADNCRECPLSCIWPVEYEMPEEALTTTIQMDSEILGYISVTADSSSSTVEERQFWLKELSNDIAFALRNLALIEDQKNAESALQQEAIRRQVLMQACRDGICIFNQDYKVVDANQRFADTLGYSPEEILDLHLWDFESNMNEEQIRAGCPDLTQVFFTFETRHRRKDGTLVDVEVSSSGALVGDTPLVFSVCRDITEKKKLHASLVQSDRLANMGLIAAGVAHEINNPLAYLLYNLESVSSDLSALKPRHQKRSETNSPAQNGALSPSPVNVLASLIKDIDRKIAEALEGARRIQGIAQTLGTFSHANMESVAPVSVNYALKCAIDMAFNEIKYRARLVTDLATVPNVMADEGSLSQVFLNLLINAAHAIDEDSVSKNEIRVKTFCQDNMVHIEIRDTGCGNTSIKSSTRSLPLKAVVLVPVWGWPFPKVSCQRSMVKYPSKAPAVREHNFASPCPHILKNARRNRPRRKRFWNRKIADEFL